jgi:hypothetical protein
MVEVGRDLERLGTVLGLGRLSSQVKASHDDGSGEELTGHTFELEVLKKISKSPVCR